MFSFKRRIRITDTIWLKAKKEKILIIDECIYIISERNFVSDIDFRKTSRDPKYIAKNCSDRVSLCIEQSTLKIMFQGFIP